MASTKKFTHVNLYDLLGIQIEAEQGEIRKAYRKKALECHPDKNPDNPKAAEKFHELARALEILTDATARTAYDKILRANKAAELRNKELDSKRLKLKTDLERREKEALNRIQKAQTYSTAQKSDEEILQEQIDRLRREGSAMLEEEQTLMREQLQRTMFQEAKSNNAFDSSQHRVKLKWKVDKSHGGASTNGGYSEEILREFLKKYGDIEALVMSKKPGRAMVEFKTLDAAEMAISYEKGLLDNSLQIDWVQKPQSKATTNNSTVNACDFEDLVLRQMRQADERKRLIEQMLREDAE